MFLVNDFRYLLAKPVIVGSESLKKRIHEVIFEADTKWGKTFDVFLLLMIIASVIVVFLESIDIYHDKYHDVFLVLEWIFTIAFTIEYFLRIYCVKKPSNYIFSFFGIVDLLAILPTYLSLLVVGTQYLIVIRAIRLLRVFRVFKLVGYMNEGHVIVESIKASANKITIFIFFVLNMVVVLGSIMYLVEGGAGSGFTSIPRSIYWAIVTLTTVGYGDIAPVTTLGQFIAAIVMILGYSVLAVPTGIVTSEFIKNSGDKISKNANTLCCRNCSWDEHDQDAIYCKKCGDDLDN